MEIKYGPSLGSTNLCTNGFNVFAGTKAYALVNAHCVVGFPYPFGGWVNNQRVSQPMDLGSTNWISRVTHNPPSSPTLPGCWSGHVCRYNDAAASAITVPTSSYDFYGIVRTNNRIVVPGVAGSIVVNSSAPRINLVGVAYLNEGDTVEKIGFKTGWTAGPIISECEYIYLALDNGGRICSTVVEAGANSGDSGLPVFLWEPAFNRARAVGILFATPFAGGAPASNEYAFSPENGIYKDFFASFPSGFTYGI